jgi:hypothetical protein
MSDMIADTPEKINAFRLLALKGALKMECLGMKRRGPSALSIVKAEFGFKGSKQKVYDLYVQHLKDTGILIN